MCQRGPEWRKYRVHREEKADQQETRVDEDLRRDGKKRKSAEDYTIHSLLPPPLPPHLSYLPPREGRRREGRRREEGREGEG